MATRSFRGGTVRIKRKGDRPLTAEEQKRRAAQRLQGQRLRATGREAARTRRETRRERERGRTHEKEMGAAKQKHEQAMGRQAAVGQIGAAMTARGVPRGALSYLAGGGQARAAPSDRGPQGLIWDARVGRMIPRAVSAGIGRAETAKRVAQKRAAGVGGRATIDMARTPGRDVDVSMLFRRTDADLRKGEPSHEYVSYAAPHLPRGISRQDIAERFGQAKTGALRAGAAAREAQATERIAGLRGFQETIAPYRAAAAPQAAPAAAPQPTATPTQAPAPTAPQVAGPTEDALNEEYNRLLRASMAIREASDPSKPYREDTRADLAEIDRRLQDISNQRIAMVTPTPTAAPATAPGGPPARDMGRTWADKRYEEMEAEIAGEQAEVQAGQAQYAGAPRRAAEYYERAIPHEVTPRFYAGQPQPTPEEAIAQAQKAYPARGIETGRPGADIGAVTPWPEDKLKAAAAVTAGAEAAGKLDIQKAQAGSAHAGSLAAIVRSAWGSFEEPVTGIYTDEDKNARLTAEKIQAGLVPLSPEQRDNVYAYFRVDPAGQELIAKLDKEITDVREAYWSKHPTGLTGPPLREKHAQHLETIRKLLTGAITP